MIAGLFDSHILNDIISLYAPGLATTHQEIQRRRDQENRRRIPEVIQHRRRHGQQSRSVAISLRTEFPTSRNRFPTVERRISESIALPLPMSLTTSVKRKKSSEEEEKQCEDLAVEWNTNPLPDDIQRKYVTLHPSQRSIDDAHLDSQS